VERQVLDENDTTSAFRHSPHARIVRIGLFEATRSELFGPVLITWVRWRLQLILRVLLGADSSCGVRRRVVVLQSSLTVSPYVQKSGTS
jgi:hypothetical protein